MKFTNPYITIAKEYPDQSVPLNEVFQEASLIDSDEIIEAIYVIGERRRASGNPLKITEVASAMSELLRNQQILDAAIDVCMDALLEQGFTTSEAYEQILQASASPSYTEALSVVSKESSFIDSVESSSEVNRKKLPSNFGGTLHSGESRYELRRVLGSGAQGTVYEALDREYAADGKPALVAIKIAHESIDAEKFQLEAARARRVRHLNVAQVLGSGLSETNEPYIVYEFIEGVSLEQWIGLQSSGISVNDACRLICKVASGIQSAHNSGVIHRDLKPSNIMMTSSGDPIVTDFGIAHTTINDTRLSSSYGTRGSLAFMSPEQYHGGPEAVMPSVDTYALGGILYWLITKQFPNGGTVSDALNRLDCRNEGGAARDYDQSMNNRLVAIIDRALEVDLQTRYASAGAFADDLDDFLSNRPIQWLDIDISTQAKLFVKRNPLVSIMYVLIIMLVSLAAGIWVQGRGALALQTSLSAAELRVQAAQAQMVIETAGLNSQLSIEQDRVRQLRERNQMAKMLVDAWSQAADSRGDEVLATSNLLFLYTMSVSGFLDDDPALADKVLNRRIEIAEEYLLTLDQNSTSPIQLAQWHEMLGVWYLSRNDERGYQHLSMATDLVSEYAPFDSVWSTKLDVLMDRESGP